MRKVDAGDDNKDMAPGRYSFTYFIGLISIVLVVIFWVGSGFLTDVFFFFFILLSYVCMYVVCM